MEPKQIDLDIYQGASFNKAWKLQDSNGDPVDLTGWSGYCHFRKKVKDEETLLIMNTENGKMSIYEEGGYFHYSLDLEPEDTQILTVLAGVYDIFLEDVAGDRIRVQEGKINVSPAVTRTWAL